MESRKYQDDLLAEIKRELKDHQSVCAVSPTGSGKTVMFLRIVQGAVARGRTVWIIVHREELVEQTCDKLREQNIAYGVIQGNQPLVNAHVQVCMIQSLKNRLSKLAPPDILIVDECHHTPASQYAAVIAWLPPTSKVIGFTATPERLDGKGLGHYYQTMVLGPSVRWLAENGYLAPAVVYAPPGVDTSGLHTKFGDFVKKETIDLMDKPKIMGDIVDQWRKHADGLQSAAFGVSVEHAQHIAAEFNRQGIPAVSLDGSLAKEERRRRIAAFRAREIRVLTNCELLTEGFDCPGIDCVIVARPTKSRALHMQIVGRAMRPDKARGKTECIILDHVGNTRLFGLPDEPYDWTLEGRKAQKKGEEDKEITLTTCPDCFCMYSTKNCPKCGFELREGRKIEYVAGELVQVVVPKRTVNREQYDRLRTVETRAELVSMCEEMEVEFSAACRILKSWAKTLADLRHVERILEFAPGWAKKLYQARHGEEGLKEALAAERAAYQADYAQRCEIAAAAQAGQEWIRLPVE